jgi:hypothetical protein
VLDVAGRELANLLHLDAIDHRLEDPFTRRVLETDGHEHHLALAVLGVLVPEPDRGGLAAALELVDEDRGVEVQDEQGRGAVYVAVLASAFSAISRSPL